MKIKQYISAAMLAMVAVGFTACDGKDVPGYDSATKPADEQRVFFASTTLSQIVDTESSSFMVNLYRAEDASSQPLTVQLIPSFADQAEAEIFSIPANVAFEAEHNMTQIEVRYDLAAMVPNQEYTFSIAVDEANADVYGLASIAITALNEQMTDWELFGYDEALGRDGYGSFTIGAPYQAMTLAPIRVFERHLPSNDAVQQFIMQIYNGEEEDESAIEHNKDMNDPEWLQVMAFNTSDGCKSISITPTVFVLDPSTSFTDAHTYMPNRFPNASYFDDITGVFTLNVMCYDDEGAFNPADWTINLAGYLDTNDYTISLTDKGQVKIDNKDYIVIGYDATSHVEYSAYTVVNSLLKENEDGDVVMDEDKYFEVVEGISKQVIDPENATTDYDINILEGVSQNITLSFPSEGDYTVVAVAFHTDNVNGLEAKSNAYVNFHYDTFNPWVGWTTVSEDAVYTDNMIAALFGAPSFANFPMEVTVQKSDDYEGLYRIANPFKEFEEYGLEVADFGSIVFDASDPDHVYFPLSDTGVRDGDDALSVMSLAYYYMANGTDPSEIPAIMWGTYKDNKVTLNAFNGAANNSNFVAYFGEEGPYLCDADFTLEFDASAPASKPGRNAARLGKSISRNLAPARGLTHAVKAYYKVGSVQANAKVKTPSRKADASKVSFLRFDFKK